MYQGWLTKWTPPKRAGKLSWVGKRSTCQLTGAPDWAGPARLQSPEQPVSSLWSPSWGRGKTENPPDSYLLRFSLFSLPPPPPRWLHDLKIPHRCQDSLFQVAILSPRMWQERLKHGWEGVRLLGGIREPRLQLPGALTTRSPFLTFLCLPAPTLPTDYHDNGCTS